jgi:exonuclease VII large subunit
MEELAHLQERLDNRDTLLNQHEIELDDLRSRLHENARVAHNIKQEALDDLEHKMLDERDHELVRKTEEIDQLQRRLSEVSSERNSRGPPATDSADQQVCPSKILRSHL